MSTESKQVFYTESAQETYDFAASMAEKVKPGQILCLNGELGVGKTVFAQGLCGKLGVTEPVNSPTFTLVNEYEGAPFPIYHFDLYRIDDADELYEIGFEDMISGGALVLIEWAERAGEILPADRVDITIERTGDDGRRITVEEQTR